MSVAVTDAPTGVELVGKIGEFVDLVERAVEVGREIGWDFVRGGFTDDGRDGMLELRCGDLIQPVLFDLMYGVSWGTDSLTELGWSKRNDHFEDARSVLEILRRRNAEEEAS